MFDHFFYSKKETRFETIYRRVTALNFLVWPEKLLKNPQVYTINLNIY